MLNLATKTDKPPIITIYGPAGIGKSTFGALAPQPVFLPTEDGLALLDTPAFPLAKSWQEVLSSLGQLATEEHDFKTVVIDSLDWMERLIHAQVCAEKNVKNLEDIGYGKGYVMAIDMWKQYIDCIYYLRDVKGMTIVQIAHAQIKRFENPETDSYDRYQIKMHEKASAIIMEASDIILFANHVVTVKKAQEGFSNRARAIGGGNRVLNTEERPAFIAKNRYNLPPEIPFDRDGSYWNVIASHVPYYQQLLKGDAE